MNENMKAHYSRGEDPKKTWEMSLDQAKEALSEFKEEYGVVDYTPEDFKRKYRSNPVITEVTHPRQVRRRIKLLTDHIRHCRENPHAFLGTRKGMGQYDYPLKRWKR